MKVYKLKTDYDCLVKVNEEESTLAPTETLEIEGEHRVLVYPLNSSKTTIPFSFDTNNLQNCKFYNFAELDKDTSLVCFHNGALCESFNITKQNIAGSNCTFEVGEHKIIISYKEWKKVISLDEKYDTFTIRHKDNIAYIKLSKPNNEAIYAINVQTGKVRAFTGNNIELLKDGFNIENYNGNKEYYKINAEGLKIEKSEGEKSKVFTLTDETVAYQFLTAIKTNNLDEAYSLCDTSLQNKITKEALKSYFGYVTNFYYISPYKYAMQSDGKLKIYNFEVQNKKITDIDE